MILAEKTCVEPVLARVVQVLVEIDQFVLHTCACMRAGAGERVATWVHFGAQYAPRPRASSSVSSVAAGSDSVGAGTLALLRTWGATVRGTCPTPEAGKCTQYVQYAAPLGQAALRLRYVPNAGGRYAQHVRTLRRPRRVRVSLAPHQQSASLISMISPTWLGLGLGLGVTPTPTLTPTRRNP